MMTTPSEWIHDDETLTDLGTSHWKVLQKKQGFRFSLDAVLLAHFAPLKNKWRVCDLGSGCGILPLLLSSRTDDLTIDGVEIQHELADMAARSLKLNSLTHIQIYEADLCHLSASWYGQYDLVVTNPPYFPLKSGKLSPLPQVAMARHELACTLDDVLAASNRLLRSGGRLAIVYRPGRLSELLSRCLAHKLTPRRLRLVYPNGQSAANLVLLEAVKGAGGELTIQAPLIIYDASGQYTPEVADYFGGN